MKKILFVLFAIATLFTACTKRGENAYIVGRDLTNTACSGVWFVEVGDKRYISDQNLELLNDELRQQSTAYPLAVKIRYSIKTKTGCGDRITVESIDLK